MADSHYGESDPTPENRGAKIDGVNVLYQNINHGSVSAVENSSQMRTSQMQMEMRRDPNAGYSTSSSAIGHDLLPNQMMQDACDRPAAGLHSRPLDESCHTSTLAGRQYQMSSDILGTGTNRSWNSRSPTMQRSEEPGGHSSPPPKCELQEHFASSNASEGNRSTEDFTRNPVTGLEYEKTSNKTARRHFEGSNANQGFW